MNPLTSIVLFGLPGAGKSTVAILIQKKAVNDYFVLDSDDIAGPLVKLGQSPEVAFSAAYDVIERQLERNAKTGSSVILSGALATHKRFSRAVELVNAYQGSDCLLVKVASPNELCLQRISQRNNYQPDRPTRNDLEEITRQHAKIDKKLVRIENTGTLLELSEKIRRCFRYGD
jgi:predicted kinase